MLRLHRINALFLLLLLNAFSAPAQELRKFGVFFGGFLPATSISAGVNYKIIDRLEVETQCSFYRTTSAGLSFGGRYFFFINSPAEKEVLAISAGFSVEGVTPVNITHGTDGVYQGTYHVEHQNYYLPHVGFRYYGKVDNAGTRIKEAYFFPQIGYRIPSSSTSVYLSDGLPREEVEKRIRKFVDGGLNFMIRFGIVF